MSIGDGTKVIVDGKDRVTVKAYRTVNGWNGYEYVDTHFYDVEYENGDVLSVGAFRVTEEIVYVHVLVPIQPVVDETDRYYRFVATEAADKFDKLAPFVDAYIAVTWETNFSCASNEGGWCDPDTPYVFVEPVNSVEWVDWWKSYNGDIVDGDTDNNDEGDE